jgi:oxygen-independent coproporphyrinogen III oxidase
MPCKQNRDEVSLPCCRALYVHVPFCLAKCRYCDFYSVPVPLAEAAAELETGTGSESARFSPIRCLSPFPAPPPGEAGGPAAGVCGGNGDRHRNGERHAVAEPVPISAGMPAKALVPEYLRAVGPELQARAGCLAAPLASVFVGGGTPTVLGPRRLADLLGLLTPWIDAQTEFSVEANPGTVDDQVAGVLAAAGVNRVNLGVQSLRDEELRVLGRIHSADGARQSVATLRAAGLDNVGLDLIYGIPGQTVDTWRQSVDQALAMGPNHLSCYALSFEPGTPLAADLLAETVTEMDEADQEACYRHAIAACATAGLEHYEISNFARPHRRCRHNLTYWHNQPYLGIGPGAASYVGGDRRTNDRDLPAYTRALLAGQAPPATSEHLEGRHAMAEAVMLALRLIDGIDRHAFAARYGSDVCEAFPNSIPLYQGLGMLEVTPDRVRICPSALFLADTILADIVDEA